MLICMLVLVPIHSALAAEAEDAGEVITLTSAGEGEDTVGITSASDGAVNYDELSLKSPSIRDENGKITTKYSGGLSCGSNMILFTDHYYDIHFDYVNKSDGSASSVVPELEIRDCPSNILGKYVRVENGSVIVEPSEEQYSFNLVLLQNGKDVAGMGMSVAKYKVEFSDILILGIAVYALVTAITGTGAMFKNEFIKEGKEEDFKKYVRICALIVGVCMLAVAFISIFLCSKDNLAWLKYVLFGVGIAALIASLVITSKMTDKEKKAKAMAAGRTGSVGDSSAAFEFDEDEPTIDDVLANMKNKDEN